MYISENKATSELCIGVKVFVTVTNDTEFFVDFFRPFVTVTNKNRYSVNLVAFLVITFTVFIF